MKSHTDASAVATVYNQFGQQYHDSRKQGHGRLFNEYLDMPATFSLLPDSLQGKKILDAGCGSGMYSRLLAQKAAVVTGVDISEKMIGIAQKETPPELSIQYSVGNLYSLPFSDKEFDLILCNYVLENIEDIGKVFKEFFRVLRSKSECIFSISHPLRAQSKKQIVDGKEEWVIADYFEEGMRMSDFGGGMMVPKYKRTLESYVKALTDAGFVISALLEPRPTPEGCTVDPENYEKAMRLPQLLTVKIVKV